jgi:hypothetical protein
VGPAAMRPSWYALARGGWRDYVTLLHVPYTAWHLSYVVVAGCLAPVMRWERLGAVVAAFALALGIGAHALDELRGRPLQTAIPAGVLVVLAVVSIGGACAIGIAGAAAWGWWLLALVAAGAFLVASYNLELFGGLFHNGFWFAFGWGAFPALTGYAVVAGEIDEVALLAAAFAFLLSAAQRVLSTPVRLVRRRVADAEGEMELDDGSRVAIDASTLMGSQERALRLLSAAAVVLAAALVAYRV